MGIGYCKKTRRQFLIGTGQTLLALPILPSLLPLEAQAQAATAPRRIMSFLFDHNQLAEHWPQQTLATTAVGGIGVREVLLRNLQAGQMGLLGDSRFNALRNADQITIVRGLNYSSSSVDAAHSNLLVTAGADVRSANGFPSFESILEQSRTLYPTSTPAIVRRAIRIHLGGTGNPYYQKVGTSAQQLPAYGIDEHEGGADQTIQTFYNEVFGALTGGIVNPGNQTNIFKTNVLNRVYPAFASFRNNRRISSNDRAVLDQHLGFLSDLQATFAQLPQSNSCTRPAQPANTRDAGIFVPAYLDLLALAFRCNLTKVASVFFNATSDFIPGILQYGANTHTTMHGPVEDFEPSGTLAQRYTFETYYRYYLNLIYDRFLTPLNVMEGDTGRTYLQNMITTIIPSGGIELAGEFSAHSGYDLQQILIGNMGGAMRSGRYYRYPEQNGSRLPSNCFLLTLMQLMGVPPADYAYATPNGQGLGYYRSGGPFSSRFYQPLTEVLA